MNDEQAALALSALANARRLALFRALVRAGPAGLTAGELACAAQLSASALTFHAKELERAGLIQSQRDGRFIRSAINVPVMRDLISFLTVDCCGGRPDLCGMAPAPHRRLRDDEPICCSPAAGNNVPT
ncbi:MAG: ArsR/SmtB family transcription factor [Deltaproteobacteria bacterium]